MTLENVESVEVVFHLKSTKTHAIRAAYFPIRPTLSGILDASYLATVDAANFIEKQDEIVFPDRVIEGL